MPASTSIEAHCKELKRLNQRIRQEAVKEASREAEKVLEISSRLVPEDTGALKEGRRLEVSKTDSGVLLEMAYGEGNPKEAKKAPPSQYAVPQHEEDLRHPRGGQRFFLKEPWEDHRSSVLDAVQAGTNRAARRLR